MARMLLLHEHFQRRALRRERLFRDRANPLEVYDDVELYERYRFRRGQLVDLVGLVDAQIKHPTNRNGALTSVQQVCLALRFFFVWVLPEPNRGFDWSTQIKRLSSHT